MENASKALLIGAGILLAMLILFIAIRIFSSASNVTEAYQSKEVSSEVATFNANFTRFVGAVVKDEEITNQNYAKIHDLISVANFAWNYNNKMVSDPLNLEDPNDERIIHVNLKLNGRNALELKDLQNYNQEAYYLLIENGYYVSVQYPNAKNTLNYRIEIENYNAEHRINNMSFYPSDNNMNLTNAVTRILANSEKYKRK